MFELASSHKIVQTEAFFWSSNKLNTMLRRYGGTRRFFSSDEFRFCVELNKRLITYHRPRTVVLVGSTHERRFAEAYGLRNPEIILNSQGEKLLVRYEDANDLPWFILRHWTGDWRMKKSINRALVKITLLFELKESCNAANTLRRLRLALLKAPPELQKDAARFILLVASVRLSDQELAELEWLIMILSDRSERDASPIGQGGEAGEDSHRSPSGLAGYRLKDRGASSFGI